MDEKTPAKLVSIETPYNSVYPWYQLRNIQYAIQCNTHAASLGDVTWVPQLTNTQYVKFGYNGYISDSVSSFLLSKFGHGYYLGRERTLCLTNRIRQTRLDAVVCYTDYGVSSGMRSAIDAAGKAGVPVEYRTLPTDLKKDIFTESIVSTSVPIIKNVSVIGLTILGLLKCIK